MHAINIELVQTTWEQVLPIADDAAQLFYNRLFELDPSRRACSVRPTCPSNARGPCR